MNVLVVDCTTLYFEVDYRYSPVGRYSIKKVLYNKNKIKGKHIIYLSLKVHITITKLVQI